MRNERDDIVQEFEDVLRPLVADMQDQLTTVEAKVEGLRELKNETDRNILASLRRIEEQTVKTNGRVTELERKEVLNKFAHVALYTVAAVVLLAVLDSILSASGLGK